MGADSYSWDYDPIGNRESYTENGTTLDYLVNQLNQYTNIANGVTLTPEYDSDGNMTNYNGWAYQWNGENRLRVASDASTSVTNKYDYMGRRISKSVDGVETEFLYDGWNLVQETTGTNVTQYVWGLDLSQSLQGAGGVGGLLCVIENGEEYYPAYDANGNITEYIDSTGTVVAHYEYSAFGKITAQSGTKADDFKFRFSTKYYDTETGLLYYGMRFYVPELGRWINRDPIGERGGMNLYAFVGNESLNTFDVNGQYDALKLWKLILSSVANLFPNNVPPSQMLAVGYEAQVLFVPGATGYAAGVNVMFFPESCEVSLFNFISGDWRPNRATDSGHESFINGLKTIFQSLGNLGLSVGVSASKVEAVPIAGNRHNYKSWEGFFYEGNIGANSPLLIGGGGAVFTSPDLSWMGRSLGVTIGAPGVGAAISALYYEEMKTWDFRDNDCICYALRTISQSGNSSAINKILRHIVK